MRGVSLWFAVLLYGLCLGCSGEVQEVWMTISPPDSAEDVEVIAGEVVGPPVGVGRFKDVRREKGELGTRIGRFGGWGGYKFLVAGGDLGASLGRALQQYLRGQGWRIVESAGGQATADIVLAGEVRQLHIRSRNSWFATRIVCEVKILVEGENRVEGSAIALMLIAQQDREVWWFEPGDVRELVQSTLRDSYAQLVEATQFKGRQLVLADR